MTEQKQDQSTTLVGMDAHSDKIVLCIASWRLGSDPVVKKVISTTLVALETTYKKGSSEESVGKSAYFDND